MLFRSRARSQRLDLRAFIQQYAGSELQLQRALLGQYPRLSITLTRTRDTGRVQTLGPAVSFDLPLWNRNRGTIAVAQATRGAVATEYAARVFALRADIAALVANIADGEGAVTALRAAHPMLAEVASASERAASRHDIAVPDALTAQGNAIDHELALLAAEQGCAEALVALEVATGRVLAASPIERGVAR